MNKAMLNLLSEEENLLPMETDKAALARLDVDELIDLHTRVRRGDRGQKSPVSKKRTATSSSAGARRQAKSDSR